MGILRSIGRVVRNSYIGFGALISLVVAALILLATAFNPYKTDHEKKILDRWTVCAATPYIAGLLLTITITLTLATYAPLYVFLDAILAILLTWSILASIRESKTHAYEYQLEHYHEHRRQREQEKQVESEPEPEPVKPATRYRMSAPNRQQVRQ